MTCFFRVLPLISLFLSNGHVSLASSIDVRAEPSVELPVPIELINPVSAQRSYVVAFEAGAKYDKSFLSKIHSTTGIVAKLEKDLTGKIFNGVSVQLDAHDSALDVESKITALPGVLGVYPNDVIEVPFVNITSVAGSDLASVRPNGSNSRIAAAAEFFTVDQTMMQVDKLRAKGITGKGIKVAVIDGQPDMSHPAIRVSFGANYQDADDKNPTPDCMGHATLCSGVVSSKPTLGGFQGIAPGVTLGHYIISGCRGGTVGKVIQAMEQAVTDGVNILSVSLGWGNPWKFIEETKIFEKIANQGILLVYPAGNGGGDGLWKTTEQCNAPGVLCVGMVDNTNSNSWDNKSAYSVDNVYTGDLNIRHANLGPGWAGMPANLPLWTNLAADAGGWGNHGGSGCAELPAGTKNLADSLVLIRRNLCNEDDMIERVVKAGARYIIIGELYEGINDPWNPDIRIPHPGVVGLATIGGKDAIDLVEILRTGKKVTIDMRNPTLYLRTWPKGVDGTQIRGNRIASGSGWGPSFDGALTVDIGGVGTDIPVILPVGSGKYGTAAGTSLAVPQVAGIAALVAEALKTTDPKVLANVLISTSKQLDRDAGGSWGPGLESVTHQGGGMIQADRAASVLATLSVGGLEFNDTLNRAKQSFTITNKRSVAVTYDISNIAAGTLLSFANASYPIPVSGNDNIKNNQYVQAGATLSFSSSKITVPANGKTTVDVTAKDPSGLDAKKLPIWSGFVALKASDGTNLTLPYLGFNGDIDRVPKVLQVNVRSTNGTTAATFPGEEIIPTIFHGMGTRQFEIFVHNAATGVRVHPGSLIGATGRHAIAYSFGWRGEIQGTKIPAGKYFIRTSALRAFGQLGSTNANDFLTVDSPPFTIGWSA